MKTKTLLAGAMGLACAAVFASLPVYAEKEKSGSTSNAAPSDSDGGRYKTEFERMDANHDGTVSREEYMKYHESSWNNMDSGKKGALTIKEYQKSWEERTKPAGDPNEGKPKLTK